MANGRRPIANVRKLVATFLGTVATFVILFGLGMPSWAIVALGVALLVLAVSLVTVNALRGGARAWVAGTAYVRSVSEPPASSAYGRCEMQILIDAPGLPPRSVKVRDPRVPVAKWPDPGATLPITVAIDDPRHVRILWDEVLTHAEAAATSAEPGSTYDDGEHDPLADDPLIGEESPPWVRRDPDDEVLPPEGDEPATADLTDDLIGLREEPVVVVRQTPGGPIVLEGTLVDAPPPSSAPLPRRAKPSPRPREAEPEPARAPAATAGASTATAAAPNGTDATTGRAETATPAAGTVLADPRPDAAATGPVGGESPAAAWRDEPAGALHDPAEEEAVLAGLTGSGPAAPSSATGPIHGVGITVLVADLERSVAFYRDLLGFFEIDGGEGNAVLASGQTRLVLRAIRDVAPINRRLVHLNLEVDDVEAVYQDLKAKGVRFTYAPRAVNRGAKLELWAAAFRDPDGHGIAITQWRERSAA